MSKKHENPEFQVICQNEANAKFFVASNKFENQSGMESGANYGMDNTGEDGSNDLF